MRWQRVLSRAAFALGFVLCLPLLVVAVCLIVLAFLCIALVLFLGDRTVRLWNALPRNRRAIDRARQALADRLPGRQARWHVARRDRHKCFVRATLTLSTIPRTEWLCAVWDDSGRVDDMGTWQFHDGIDLGHAAHAYEQARAAGQPWPCEMSALVETMQPAASRPESAPELRPHFGSVLLYRQNGFAFYAYANTLGAALGAPDLEGAEAYDAECRRLRLEGEPWVRVMAPFPPTPPDKVFVVRLRHYLMAQAGDEQTRDRLREMLPAELVDYGIRTYDDSGMADDVVIQ